MSFKSGVMTCRSNVGGVTMGEKFSMLSTGNFEKIDMESNTNNLDETTKGFLKGVATTCRSMGHTEEAAKFARRCMFAMLDRYGLNSLFLSTTPDDECSFRVRLYSKPQNWVSCCIIKTKTLYSYKPIGAALRWHLVFGGKVAFWQKRVLRSAGYGFPRRKKSSASRQSGASPNLICVCVSQTQIL